MDTDIELEIDLCPECGHDAEHLFESYYLGRGGVKKNMLHCGCQDVVICGDCEDAWHIDEMQNTRTDRDYYDLNEVRHICPTCASAHYHDCNECGDELVHNDWRVCQDCINEDNDYDGPIRPYCHSRGSDFGFKQTTSEAKVATNKRYFGVELEWEAVTGPRGGIVESIPEDASHYIFKEDGSLSDGAELVTAPMTLKYWHSKEKWLRVSCKALTETGARAHNTKTCGFHIHVSRNTLTPKSELALALLFYRHEAAFLPLLRRESSSYCKNKELHRIDGSPCYDRYEALNYTDTETVEFRRPKGTLNPDTILATIELFDAMILTAETYSSEMITTDGFKYLLLTIKTATEKGRYKFISKYLVRRKVIEKAATKTKKKEASPACA